LRYISILQLQKEFGYHPIDDKESFLTVFSQMNQTNFSKEEVLQFIEIQKQQTQIFNAWIEQHKGLFDLLLYGDTPVHFEDKLKWKEHRFYDQFQNYISPFFEFIITQDKTGKSFRDWAIIFSYFELMNIEKRFVLEQKFYSILYKKIYELIEKQKSQKVRGQFESDMLKLLDSSVIKVHSLLSNSSNSIKINFIDNILQFFKHPLCSSQLANWMVLQLQQLKLNEQQLVSLEKIKNSINNGDYLFNSAKTSTRNSLSIKQWFSLTAIVGFILIIYFILTVDFSTKPQFVHEGSALKYFSVKERKEIDSIIRSMDTIPKLNRISNYLGSGISVYLQKIYNNKVARQLIWDLELDRDLHYSARYDTIEKLNSNELKSAKFNQRKALTERKSNFKIELRNDSDYSLIVLCWDEKSKSNCYSSLIPPKSIIQFNANKEDYFHILPGFEFSKIPIENQSQFKLLNIHFGRIDFNFESALQELLVLKSPNSAINKLLVSGKKGDFVEINDVNGGFERI